MKLTLLSGLAVLIAAGCSTGPGQTTQRIGRWEEHPGSPCSCVTENLTHPARF
jgi:hypothetical protein